MGSCAVAIVSIWNQWSMREKSEHPPSSAARAVAARVGARASGPPGSVKLAKWIPSFMTATLWCPDGRVRCSPATNGVVPTSRPVWRSAAAQRQAWRAVERPPYHAQRHVLDSALGRSMARDARTLRQMAKRLRPLQPLEIRRGKVIEYIRRGDIGNGVAL